MSARWISENQLKGHAAICGKLAAQIYNMEVLAEGVETNKRNFTRFLAIADRVLYEANVFLTPGFIFGNLGERYIRISLCCKNETLEEALKRIKKIYDL